MKVIRFGFSGLFPFPESSEVLAKEVSSGEQEENGSLLPYPYPVSFDKDEFSLV